MNKLLYFAQKGVILNKEKDSVLVSKFLESKYLPDKLVGKLCLIGGRLHEGEADLESSFIARVNEETGIIIKPGLPFYIWNWTYEKDGQMQQIVAIARLAIYDSGELRGSFEKHETSNAAPQWVKISELEIDRFVIDEQPVLRKFLEYIKDNPFEEYR